MCIDSRRLELHYLLLGAIREHNWGRAASPVAGGGPRGKRPCLGGGNAPKFLERGCSSLEPSHKRGARESGDGPPPCGRTIRAGPAGPCLGGPTRQSSSNEGVALKGHHTKVVPGRARGRDIPPESGLPPPPLGEAGSTGPFMR